MGERAVPLGIPRRHPVRSDENAAGGVLPSDGRPLGGNARPRKPGVEIRRGGDADVVAVGHVLPVDERDTVEAPRVVWADDVHAGAGTARGS
jgi:hypothetical protein